MNKLWAGRTAGTTANLVDEINSSIGVDKRLYKRDIAGSIAHAKMMAKQNIISQQEADALIEGLTGIEKDITSGALKIDETAEDIHMFVEQVLTERIGDTGKMLHTARSRNDQVALDTKLYSEYSRTRRKRIRASYSRDILTCSMPSLYLSASI